MPASRWRFWAPKVPATVNSTDNVTMADVVGRKDDTQAGDSLAGRSYAVYQHLHSPSWVRPTLSDPVDCQAGAGAWTIGAPQLVIVPDHTGLDPDAIHRPFDIHWVNVETVSTNTIFELVIYYDLFTGGVSQGQVEWGRCRASRPAVQAAAPHCPVQSPILPAGTAIYVAAASQSAASPTASVSLEGHTYG